MMTMSAQVTMSAELTKSGLVALWECGGGCCNTGGATIIAKQDGSKPTAVFVRHGGHLANAHHALVPVHKGYYVIVSNHQRGDFEHDVYKVLETSVDPGGWVNVHAVVVNKYDKGEWSEPLAPKLEAAVSAAEGKARDYHCRVPWYVVEKEKEKK